ncbi:ATP-binding protein [Pseudomonas sp. MWU12-2345]|uniref:AAA family ATPase n=1 Tax=Pseudomonas sp. MWU12-2345 TaxID=2928689 RepID=UPI00200F8794|nr:ATP-binding protein [Pseudomonas sp. MWU12-2345]
MLIEFSVSNFRSFREKKTLSMVATPRLSKKRNVVKAPVTGEKFPDLLKVAAIYGPNASGKSSLLEALDVVRKLITSAPSATESLLPVKPFRFDASLKEEPSRFEYNFIKGGNRYQFNVGLTEKRIVDEKLVFFPRGKETLLYERRLDSTGEVYIFGEGLEGGKDIHRIWQRLTSPRVLFIAQAVANSSEDLVQLRAPFEWFARNLTVLAQGTMPGWSNISMRILKNNDELASNLAGFLQEVDVPISKIRVDEGEAERMESVGKNVSEHSVAPGGEVRTTLTHRSLLGEAEFEFSEESGGTKNLIGFWLPWTSLSLPLQHSSGVLVVDELDSSLHPDIVADLIEKHLDIGLETQLIFTTHDTHLMNAKILRRDQFWITERDANGATNLFSIHDFEGREGEDVEKRYFEGRYRGLPLIRRK